jgi:trk system potassium uptake protein TrkH
MSGERQSGRRVLAGLVTHPSQTVVLSFLTAILVGTALLALPFASAGEGSLSFLESLFTATSAVCVTGLIVVDTATELSFWGQLIVLVLIQAGGLGIMLLSFFVVFSLRRRVSLQDRVLVSYMLQQRDVSTLRASVRRIVLITVSIEAVGALLLFFAMGGATGAPVGSNGALGERIFSSVFHAVSAFCNAGFALFSESFTRFLDAPGVNFTVAALIILGGLSFTVLSDLHRVLADGIRTLFRGGRRVGAPEGRGGQWGLERQRQASGRTRARQRRLSVNSRLVLLLSGVLLLLGTALIYALEHARTLADFPLGTQYLASFFQAVTLRTAGFNTVSIAALGLPTLVALMAFMFVGGAAGGTAGGIKVNSLGVIGAFLASRRNRMQQQVRIFRHAIPGAQVHNAFTVMLFGVATVFVATFLLTITEGLPLEALLFEAVSAFGTVGLSTGITGELSPAGRLVITVLMFVGRLGPLTLLAASLRRERRVAVEYPEADIQVG